MESALQNATVVVLAQVVSTVQHSTTDSADPRAITEEATFRVIESFKGSLRPGDLLPIRSKSESNGFLRHWRREFAGLVGNGEAWEVDREATQACALVVWDACHPEGVAGSRVRLWAGLWLQR